MPELKPCPLLRRKGEADIRLSNERRKMPKMQNTWEGFP